MSYILTDGLSTIVTYPYSIPQLLADNPNTSFPSEPDNTLLAEWNVFPVTETPFPSYNVLTERVEEGTPLYSAGTWAKTWNTITLTPSEQIDIYDQYATAAETEANARYGQTNEYVVKALTETLTLHPDMIQYRSDLVNYTALPGFPNAVVWPTFPTNIFDVAGLPIDTYTTSEIDTALSAKVDVSNAVFTGTVDLSNNTISNLGSPSSNTDATNKEYVDTAIANVSSANLTNYYTKTEVDTRTFDNRVIYIEPESGTTTSNTLFANAMTTIGSTSLYRVYVGSGIYSEPSFNIASKNQLNIIGPDAGGTTSATITNGVTISTPSGNRFTNLRFANTVSITTQAGLGTYFNKVQFGGPVTIFGTGGFIVFNECDFESDVGIDAAFAGQVYINRSALSGASATYTFSQPLAVQVIIADTTGLPNAMIAKAAYTGVITKKNNTQFLYLNNTKINFLSATESTQPANNHVLVFSTTSNSWTTAAQSDTSKVPLAGGTMTGLLTLSGAPSANLHAATKQYVDSAVAGAGGSVNTAATYTWTNTHSFNWPVNFNGNPINFGSSTSITINGNSGSNGQVLTSNGSSGVYWSTPTSGGLPSWTLMGSTASGNINLPGGVTFDTFKSTYKEMYIVVKNSGGTMVSSFISLAAVTSYPITPTIYGNSMGSFADIGNFSVSNGTQTTIGVSTNPSAPGPWTMSVYYR